MKNAGAVYGVDMASKATVSSIFGVSAKSALGTSLQDVGDVDGDGYSDWLLATPKQTNPLAANNKKQSMQA